VMNVTMNAIGWFKKHTWPPYPIDESSVELAVRVFKSKTGMNLSERSRLIIYVLYSYGTPVIIVGLNIVITASSTDDSSIGYGGRQ
jgi:hypothetical protein